MTDQYILRAQVVEVVMFGQLTRPLAVVFFAGFLTAGVALATFLASSAQPQGEVALPLYINAGGEQVTDGHGNVWEADQGWTEGRAWDAVNRQGPTGTAAHPVDVAGTDENAIFSTERWGMDAYHMDIANGVYTVWLLFAETYEGITGPGQRVFDVEIAGRTALAGLDVYAEAGFGRALVKEITDVEVADGRLSILFHNRVEEPMVNGIVVSRAGDPAPLLPVHEEAPGPAPTPTPEPAPEQEPFDISFTCHPADPDVVEYIKENLQGLEEGERHFMDGFWQVGNAVSFTVGTTPARPIHTIMVGPDYRTDPWHFSIVFNAATSEFGGPLQFPEGTATHYGTGRGWDSVGLISAPGIASRMCVAATYGVEQEVVVTGLE